MRQIISAGAVIYRHDPKDGKTRFLLLYHGKDYWNFPKGKLEHGEKATAAFLREVEEETGLKRHHLRIVSGFRETDRYILHPRKQEVTARVQSKRDEHAALKIVIYYLVETRERTIAVSHEHDGFGWFTYHESLRIAKYKNTQEIIRRANEFIGRNLRRHSAHSPGPRRHVR